MLSVQVTGDPEAPREVPSGSASSILQHLQVQNRLLPALTGQRIPAPDPSPAAKRGGVFCLGPPSKPDGVAPGRVMASRASREREVAGRDRNTVIG